MTIDELCKHLGNHAPCPADIRLVQQLFCEPLHWEATPDEYRRGRPQHQTWRCDRDGSPEDCWRRVLAEALQTQMALGRIHACRDGEADPPAIEEVRNGTR